MSFFDTISRIIQQGKEMAVKATPSSKITYTKVTPVNNSQFTSNPLLRTQPLQYQKPVIQQPTFNVPLKAQVPQARTAIAETTPMQNNQTMAQTVSQIIQGGKEAVKLGGGVVKEVVQGTNRTVGTALITAGNAPTQLVNKVSGGNQPTPFQREIDPKQGGIFSRIILGDTTVKDLPTYGKAGVRAVNEITGSNIPENSYTGIPFAIGGLALDLSGTGKAAKNALQKVASNMTAEDATILRNLYAKPTAKNVMPVARNEQAIINALKLDKLPYTEQKTAVDNILKEYDKRWGGVDEALNPPIPPNRPGAMDVKKPIPIQNVVTPKKIENPTPVNKKLERFRAGKPSLEAGNIRNPLAKTPEKPPANNQVVSSGNDSTRPKKIAINDETRSRMKQAEEMGLYETQKRNLNPEALDQRRLELSLQKEALDNDPANGLGKFGTTRGEFRGQLKEVNGKGNLFGRQGDDIADQFGFKSSEEARQAYDNFKARKQQYDINKANLAEDIKIARIENKNIQSFNKAISPFDSLTKRVSTNVARVTKRVEQKATKRQVDFEKRETKRQVDTTKKVYGEKIKDEKLNTKFVKRTEQKVAVRQVQFEKREAKRAIAKKRDEVMIKMKRLYDEKVSKINTVKDILDRRREFIRAVQKQFGLSDTDLKTVSRKDIRLMSNFEFKQHLDNIRLKAEQLADKMQAKAELIGLLERKNFQKVENYRLAQKLPSISEMSASQLREYATALEKFNTGDIFLTKRQLEVVDRSNLVGVKTLREAKERLLVQIQKTKGMENITIEDLNVTPTVLDTLRYDTALAEKNPFYNYLVTRTQTHIMGGEMKYLDVQSKVQELAKKAKASRPSGVSGALRQAFIPTHHEIIRYLEAPIDQKAIIAKTLTPAELEYANFVSDYYSKAYDHLIKQEELFGSRYVDEYFTHIRRDFLEAWSDDGFIKAMKEWWQSQKDSQLVANIIDQDTGKILPKSKFFQYTMKRTGELGPSKNLTRVFLQYSKTFERKKMFDAMIPELDIYVQSLTPTGLTKNGLETDRQLKTFVNQYINNKKGRQINFSGIVKQNGNIDIALRMGNTLVSIIDLGLSVLAQTAATVGEFVTTYQALGKVGMARALKRRLWDTGITRMTDPNATKILKEAEAFIGRNIWTDILDVDTPILDRGMKTIFGGFAQATVEANKLFLLGTISKAELAAGKLSAERLAELRLSAGRWRDLGKDVKSIVGSTSVGQMTTKYKGWAIPIARTNIKNLETLGKNLKSGNIKKAITSREIQETYRLIELSAVMVLIGSYVMSQDEDETFIGKLKAKAYRESMTLLGGIDPTMFLSTPRLYSFAQQLVKNLKSIALLEEYKTTTKYGEEGTLKGVAGLTKQLTPAVFRQGEPKGVSSGDTELDKVLKAEKKADKTTTNKVTAKATQMMLFDKEEQEKQLKEIAKTDKDFALKVRDKLREENKKKDWSDVDKGIAQLGVENGSRANYVYKKMRELPAEERNAYIKDLHDRKVISDEVLKQIKELHKKSKENNDIIQ